MSSLGVASGPRALDPDDIRLLRPAELGTPRRGGRRIWPLGLILAATLAALWYATRGETAIFNSRGWPQFREFFGAALHPALDQAFLSVVWRATLVTLGYAVVGTALAVVVGLTLAVAGSQAFGRGAPSSRAARAGRGLIRTVLVPMRAVHEAVWAVLLVQVLGINPLVAIISIGIPFGAVTARVYGQMLDDASSGSFVALRAAGAGRLQAAIYGLLPEVGGNLIAYGCYRFECAIRAAAVLGVIGAGGLGFQIKVSFQSLAYGEMWTLLYVVIALCALADGLSGRMRSRWRRASRDERRQRQVVVARGLRVAALASVPIAWWYLNVHPSTLWSERTVENAERLGSELFPPRLPGTWGSLSGQCLETMAMSVLAIAIAVTGGIAMALVAARPATSPSVTARLGGLLARTVLLVARAIPPPVWAFVFLFIFFPGVVPGAIALGVYNLGVLGRLMAELVENEDDRPAVNLRATGAGRVQVFLYDRIPRLGQGFAALGVYRWEVAIRETVVVGLVAAGGLGAALGQDIAAFDYPAITTTLLALIAVTAVADITGAWLRRALR